MIHLIDVSKSYVGKAGRQVVLRCTNLSIPLNRRVGVLGRNGAGKSTLLKLISGVEKPDQGRIIRTGRISWPLGFSGGLHPELSGRENVSFVARIYASPVDEVIAFVEDFSQLGKYLSMPVRTYSAGMRAKLAFGLSMAIDFDCYLVDEITAVGDHEFQKKCRAEFMRRAEKSGLLFVSHSENTIRSYCEVALVFRNGYLVPFDDISAAISFYNAEAAS